MSERANVIGVGVSAVNMETALAVVKGWIDRRERHYVCVTGVHGVMESRRSPSLRVIHNRAGLVLPDGMPLVWMLKLAGFRHADRVCGPEFMPRLIEESVVRGDRHYLYGGSEQALAALQSRLRILAPGVDIVGAHSPPYRSLTEAEDDAVVAAINAAKPDVVWVGLSTPKQERWMAAHRGAAGVTRADRGGRRLRHPCRHHRAGSCILEADRFRMDLSPGQGTQAALETVSVEQPALRGSRDGTEVRTDSAGLDELTEPSCGIVYGWRASR